MMSYVQVKHNIEVLIKNSPFVLYKNQKIASFVYTNIYYFTKVISELTTKTVFHVMKVNNKLVHHATIRGLNTKPLGLVTTKKIPGLTQQYGQCYITPLHPQNKLTNFYTVNHAHAEYNSYFASLSLEHYFLYLFNKHDVIETNLLPIQPNLNVRGVYLAQKKISSNVNTKLASSKTINSIKSILTTPQTMFDQPNSKTQEILNKRANILLQKYKETGYELTDKQMFENPNLNEIIYNSYIQPEQLARVIRKTSFIEYSTRSGTNSQDFDDTMPE